MLIDNFKIAWRYFTNGFVLNLVILFFLIFFNVALLLGLMIKVDYLTIVFCSIALIGYAIISVLLGYSTKYREKEVSVRKLLGAKGLELYALLSAEVFIYTFISASFSLIILEQTYQHTELLNELSFLFVIKFIVILLILSLLISIYPAMRLIAINPIDTFNQK